MREDIILGFSTGCLYKNIDPLSVDAIEAIGYTKCNAIELFAGFKEQINRLYSIKESDLKTFKYVSLHAPNDIVYDSSAQTQQILSQLSENHKRLNFNLIVVHGNNVISGDIFEEYNLPIAIENDDTNFGKSVNDMSKIFKKFDTKMVLDVLHSYIATKSVTLTGSLYDQFKDRIVQVNLSGFGDYDDLEQQHYLMNQTDPEDKRYILRSVPRNLPIIIESTFPKYFTSVKLLYELLHEYRYIQDELYFY